MLLAGCVAGAANAATFHYRLTHDHTLFSDVSSYTDTSDGDVYHASLSSADDPWGLPLLFAGLTAGNSYDFRAEITDDTVVSCSIGTFDCKPAFDPYFSYTSTTPLMFGDELFHVSFGEAKRAANSMLVSDVHDGNSAGFYIPQGAAMINVRTRSTYFTVSEPAPVPLPAGIALLPVGLAGLAVLRRRKRAA
ncbi:VPLPA-CTERM sorting domain-containing protein [Paracoccus amoyensis]|nr:VPLPA-CTERM sorting domain-containing protein [Paracoccus amoyensis]